VKGAYICFFFATVQVAKMLKNVLPTSACTNFTMNRMGGMEWTDLVQEKHTIVSYAHGDEPYGHLQCREFLY
jgi:hypothetical protein